MQGLEISQRTYYGGKSLYKEKKVITKDHPIYVSYFAFSERRGVPSRVRLGVAGADLPVRRQRGKDRSVVHGPGTLYVHTT